MKTTNISEAVHEARENQRVTKFITEEGLKPFIVKIIENGDLWGIYYDDEGNLVAEDKSGDIHEDILIEDLEDISTDLVEPFPETSLHVFFALADAGKEYSVNGPFYEKLENEHTSHFDHSEDVIIEYKGDFVHLHKDFNGGYEYVKLLRLKDIADAIGDGTFHDDGMENHIDLDPLIEEEGGDPSDYEFRYDHVAAELSANAEGWWPMILRYSDEH